MSLRKEHVVLLGSVAVLGLLRWSSVKDKPSSSALQSRVTRSSPLPPRRSLMTGWMSAVNSSFASSALLMMSSLP